MTKPRRSNYCLHGQHRHCHHECPPGRCGCACHRHGIRLIEEYEVSKDGSTKIFWGLMRHGSALPVLFATKQDARENCDPDEYLVRVRVEVLEGRR